MSDEYASVEGNGFAYAVTLKSGKTRRFHDPAPIQKVMERMSRDYVDFVGVSDEDEESPSTYAGRVLTSEVAALSYWTPQDDQPSDAATEAAAALLGSLAEAASSGGSGIKL